MTWDGLERRATEDQRRAVLDDLVSTAVQAAISRQSRALNASRRMMVALTVALVAIAIVTGSVYIKHAARVNTRYNCQLIQDVAHHLGGFVRTDATDRAGDLSATDKAQVNAAFGKLFTPPLLARLERKTRALDMRTIQYWRGWVLNGLEDAARVNCAHHG